MTKSNTWSWNNQVEAHQTYTYVRTITIRMPHRRFSLIGIIPNVSFVVPHPRFPITRSYNSFLYPCTWVSIASAKLRSPRPRANFTNQSTGISSGTCIPSASLVHDYLLGTSMVSEYPAAATRLPRSTMACLTAMAAQIGILICLPVTIWHCVCRVEAAFM
jgi:hypothetical protein